MFLGAEADVIVGIYSNLLTFLGGGRACIGFKFSQLEMSACRCVVSLDNELIPAPPAAEVVLVMLLSKFTFAPSDQDVYWNLAGIQYPTVGKNSPQPQLPMKVGFVGSS